MMMTVVLLMMFGDGSSDNDVLVRVMNSLVVTIMRTRVEMVDVIMVMIGGRLMMMTVGVMMVIMKGM